MIFATVGTHEQPFNRMLIALDELVSTGAIREEVFVQSGYCTYIPKFCKHQKFLSPDLMKFYMNTSDVIITHGGPSSFMEAMAAGKVPVVIPRYAKFGEHVNDHQGDFVQLVAARLGGIVPVYDITNLSAAVEVSRSLNKNNDGLISHTSDFCNELSFLIKKL